MSGILPVAPDFTGVSELDSRTPNMRLRLAGLTPREVEATLLAARGLRVNQIAQEMQVTAGTIKSLLARARDKLGCPTMRDLALLCLTRGLIAVTDLRPASRHRTRLQVGRKPSVVKKSTGGGFTVPPTRGNLAYPLQPQTHAKRLGETATNEVHR